MWETILSSFSLLVIINVLLSFGFVNIKEKGKRFFSYSVYVLGLGISLFFIYKFYVSRISSIDTNYFSFGFDEAGMLLLLSLSALVPFGVQKMKLFTGNNTRFIYYNLVYALTSVSLFLPFNLSVILWFLAVIGFYFLLLTYTFNLHPVVWIISRVAYITITFFLLLSYIVVGNVFIYELHLITEFLVILIIASPFVVNLWSYSLIKHISKEFLPLFFFLTFGGGLYLMKNFLYLHPDLTYFHRVVGLVGVLSALLSIITAYSVKEEYKNFVFFIMATVSGIGLTMVGLKIYFPMSFNIDFSFYFYTVFISFIGLTLVKIFVSQERNDMFTYLFEGVFLFSILMLPPFSSFFSILDFLTALMSYNMYSWVILLGVIWILLVGVGLNVFAKEFIYIKTSFNIKLKKSWLWILLGLVLLFVSYINIYYAAGMWGVSYSMLYWLVAIYLASVLLPKWVHIVITVLAFSLEMYSLPVINEVKLFLSIILFTFIIWAIIDKKQKGLLPSLWIVFSAILGVLTSTLITTFMFWMVLGNIGIFLLLLFVRYDKLSISSATRYLYLSLIGDILIFFVFFLHFDGTSLPTLSNVLEHIVVNKYELYLLLLGIFLRLPITGLNFWLEKISLESIIISFFPLLLFMKVLLLSRINVSWDSYGLQIVLLFLMIYSIVKSLDADTMYSFMKNFIPATLDMILILFLVRGVSLYSILATLLSFSFVLFLYFVSVYMVKVFDTDKFSKTESLFNKNPLIGVLVFITFIIFFSGDVTGLFLSDYVMLDRPAISFIVLFFYGLSVAYVVYNFFSDGINVNKTNRWKIPMTLFLLMFVSMLILWIGVIYLSHIDSSMVFSSALFFGVLLFSFFYGNMSIWLRRSKTFEVFRQIKNNWITKHLPMWIKRISQFLLIFYRDNGGYVFNIILFIVLILVFVMRGGGM